MYAFYSLSVEPLPKKSKLEFKLTELPVAVKKAKEETSELPDPFSLPSNFRPDVKICLSQGKITKTCRTAFFSAVASAMYRYKRYPTRDDYVSVARQNVEIYPLLGSPQVGTSYVRLFTHS